MTCIALNLNSKLFHWQRQYVIRSILLDTSSTFRVRGSTLSICIHGPLWKFTMTERVMSWFTLENSQRACYRFRVPFDWIGTLTRFQFGNKEMAHWLLNWTVGTTIHAHIPYTSNIQNVIFNYFLNGLWCAGSAEEWKCGTLPHYHYYYFGSIHAIIYFHFKYNIESSTFRIAVLCEGPGAVCVWCIKIVEF